MVKNSDLVNADKISISNKIYTIRGIKVMLDSDLAEIYGYETKYLNRQVSRNKEKFEGTDFMFQLTWEEVDSLRCQIGTLAENTFDKHIKYLPYAFTEQGIYMLMTVLRGELATKQSRALVIAFKSMKDYILDSQPIATKTIQNSEDILELKTDVKSIKSELKDMIKRSEISPIALDFSKMTEPQELLFMNGEIVKARDTIISIYNKAKHKIIIIDNYVNYNTLRLLLEVKAGLEIFIYTNNANNYLKDDDMNEFKKERPDVRISFIKIEKIIHDRFIILDDNKIYNLGASSKDFGKKVSMVHEVTDKPILELILGLIQVDK